MLANVEASMRDLDVAEITSHDVMDLRDQWRDKPRTANKYQALVSVLMAYAIDRRIRTENPCRDVKKLREVRRKRLMSHDEQLKIGAAAMQGARGWKNANGAMYAALFDFAYLSAVRARDARSLRWTDVDDARGEILIEPTKTRDSSGAKIAIVITPDIRAVLETVRALGKVKSMFVFHTLKGKPFSASAIKSAWRRARERAGVTDAWFPDLRPKALSDAKRQGLSLEKVRDAAGHTSVSNTEDYMRGSIPCEFALRHGVQGSEVRIFSPRPKSKDKRPLLRPFVQQIPHWHPPPTRATPTREGPRLGFQLIANR